MAARARTLRGVNPLPLIARVLRGVANMIDPPLPEPPRMADPPGAYYVDMANGRVWRDGSLISEHGRG
jgi:hypothetical protein